MGYAGLLDNESTRQLVGRQPDGIRRTTRQLVNDTTSTAAAGWATPDYKTTSQLDNEWGGNHL